MSTASYDMVAMRDRRHRTLNFWLWVAQFLLAAFFLLVGYMHAIMPIEKAAKLAEWITGAPVALVRFIGIAELAGAVGLVLPATTRIKPWLTPLAAAGLAVIMLLAMPVHIVRGEISMLGRNIAVLSVAAFITWGRTRGVPISARRKR